MSSLKDVNLKSVYRTGNDDLLKDFYIPTLKEAKYYDRAVGYFSTSLLAYALKGISSILENDGCIRLVVGHPIDDAEFEALKEGERLKVISTILNNELDNLISSATTRIEQARLQLFMLLIATNKMELKFAFKSKGMYHEKFGIIKDSSGNKILFHGSANETRNAINPDLNFESIAIYKNWQPEIYAEYAEAFEIGFEDIWSGNDKNIVTIDMPSEMYENISSVYREKSIIINNALIDEVELISELETIRINNYPIIPKIIKGSDFKIFKHQEDALKSWFANGRKGLFQLATGTGKTITAMYGVSTIFQKASRPRKMLLIVAVPYKALAEQWVKELSLFNIKPIKCFISKHLWEEKLSNSINLLQNGDVEFVSVVVVNRTLTSQRFNSLINRVNKKSIFFIGDECHHHANENTIKYLPEAAFRMGLSATPYINDDEIEFDEPNVEKEILTGFYGNVIADYSLAKALANGILTPYKYYIVAVNLTVQESECYLDLTKEIGRLIAIDKSKSNKALSNTIRKRNKIISNTEMKCKALDSLLKDKEFNDKEHTLFYVGEGASVIEDDVNLTLKEDMSQLEVIAKVLRENDWRASKFTTLENQWDRQNIMENFVEGSIDALVSMRVLDEGIDIPECKRAFILASSRNSRQFIQRRGRILRRSEGKEYAEVYDFVVLPNDGVTGLEQFTKLVTRELTRVMDFVRLSSNRKSCEEKAQNIANKFGLDLREI